MKPLIVKTKLSKKDDVINYYAHFGYKLINENQSNKRVELVFERIDVDTISELKNVESEYNKLSRNMPLAASIWLGVGVLFVIAYIILKSIPEAASWAFIAIPLIGICAGIAVFLLIVFIVSITNRKKIQKDLIYNADVLSGVIKLYPEARNIENPTEQTFLLRNNIDSLLKK